MPKNSTSSLSLAISNDSERQTQLYTSVMTPDIDYLGTGAAERMDIYYPSDADPAEHFPAILIIHGGGWTGGDKASDRKKNLLLINNKESFLSYRKIDEGVVEKPVFKKLSMA